VWCQKLKQDVFSTEEFKAENKYFVFCHINGDDNGAGKAVAQTFNVQGFPDIRFLRADGSQLSQIGGFEPGPQFIADMEKVRTSAGL